MDHSERLSKIAILEPYIQLEGTELGEAWYYLTKLASYPDNISGELLKAVDEELIKTVDYLASHAKIVKRKETQERAYEELEWYDE